MRLTPEALAHTATTTRAGWPPPRSPTCMPAPAVSAAITPGSAACCSPSSPSWPPPSGRPPNTLEETMHYAEAIATDWLELAHEMRAMPELPETAPERREMYLRSAMHYE